MPSWTLTDFGDAAHESGAETMRLLVEKAGRWDDENVAFYCVIGADAIAAYDAVTDERAADPQTT